MKVLVVRPMEMPEVQEIDHTLSAMQELVGGTIQAVYPFDDPVALIANDEGKLLGLPWNRALTDDHGVPYDIVCGTFFVAGLKEDHHCAALYQIGIEYADGTAQSDPDRSGIDPDIFYYGAYHYENQ